MMKNKTKLALSAKEQELVCNTEWILTKQIITVKIVQLFSDILVSLKQFTTDKESILPPEVFVRDPKISKGENYRGLPYIMLDYPRYFDKENTLAIRTLFWWGNFFSINLQLSGSIKTEASSHLQDHFVTLRQNDFWICTNNNPWQHYFEEGNFTPIKNLTKTEFTNIIYRESFVKIGKKISIEHWDTATQFIEHSFEEMLLLLEYQLPKR